MADRKFSRRRTQIDDLPSCLIIDILSRLPIETLVISRFVCKSWSLLFSDPLFVRLQSARSPTCILSEGSELKRDLRCYKPVGEMVGKDFEADRKIRIPDSTLTCDNSCHGLLCLRKGYSIYVCNPILGEYIILPIVKTKTIPTRQARMSTRSPYRIKSVLGFSSRSNQFKVLQINCFKLSPASGYIAELYTIGDGTRQWKSMGTAPSCPLDFPDDSVLNGSIHWVDERSRQIFYFDFESEQFGSLPSPPALCNGRWSSFEDVSLRVCALDGCLCMYALGYDVSQDYPPEIVEKWMMKEYGVEESWTTIFSTQNNQDLDLTDHCDGGVRFPYHFCTITYNPSFISLQDVARNENVTVLSRTRSKDQDSQEVISKYIFQLWGEREYEEAAAKNEYEEAEE